jgi:hypothetical protein
MRLALTGLLILTALLEGIALQVLHYELCILYQAGLSSQGVPALTRAALQIGGYPEPSGSMAFVLIQVLPIVIWSGLALAKQSQARAIEGLVAVFVFNWFTFLTGGFALLVGLRTLNLPILLDTSTSSLPLSVGIMACGYMAIMFWLGRSSRKLVPIADPSPPSPSAKP